MSTLSQIRVALAAAANNVNGMPSHAYQPLRPRAPCTFWRRVSGPQWETMGSTGSRTVTFELVVLVNWQDGERAQEALDSYVEATGATSVRAKLETDRTLGSVVLSLDVGEWGEDEIVEVSGVEYGSASVPVQISYR